MERPPKTDCLFLLLKVIFGKSKIGYLTQMFFLCYRSEKSQLRWYEKMDGRIHHSAMLKEYSRSSADQVTHLFIFSSVLTPLLNVLSC